MSTAYYEKLVQEDLDTGNGTTTKRNPGGGTLSATQVSLSSLAVGQASGSATWDPGSIASGSFEAKDVTVSGAALGDYAIASFSLDVANEHRTVDRSARTKRLPADGASAPDRVGPPSSALAEPRQRGGDSDTTGADHQAE